jgi:drug/metabolite transporter (DMT)-like permease
MVWGSTFLVVQKALSASGAFFFVGARFAAAALLIALLTGRSLRGLTWGELRAGCLIGVAIMLGYSLQTIGLETILSSKSAFLTALAIPLVPVMQWIFLRRLPRPVAWIGISLAFTGVLLLTGANASSLNFSTGEIVTAFCAIAFAAEIILIGAFAASVDARRVTVIQLAATAILAFAAMIPAGESIPPFSWLLFLSVAGMAAASAAIQLAMNWAQKTVSPTRSSDLRSGRRSPPTPRLRRPREVPAAAWRGSDPARS